MRNRALRVREENLPKSGVFARHPVHTQHVDAPRFKRHFDSRYPFPYTGKGKGKPLKPRFEAICLLEIERSEVGLTQLWINQQQALELFRCEPDQALLLMPR